MTKPTKWVCTQQRLRSAWASALSDQSSLSAWRYLRSSATHWAHSKDGSDWADAQADLSLRWVHTHFVGFVMLWLTYWSSRVLIYWLALHIQPICQTVGPLKQSAISLKLSNAPLHIIPQSGASLSANPGSLVQAPARPHTFMEINHEIISTAILPLPLIQ